MKAEKKKPLFNKLDTAFSLLIRSRGRCERCGMAEYSKLQTSHIFSRSNLSVRWNTLNANCLCAKCHFWWHKNPLQGAEWLKTIYTPEQIKELTRRANEIKKWTIPELKSSLEELQSLCAVLTPEKPN